MRQKKKILIGVGLGALALFFLGKSKFHNIVKNQRIRRQDKWGDGAYMACRDDCTRKHEGLDVVTIPGEEILSPVDGFIRRHSVSSNDDYKYGLSGYHILTDEYLIKLWYLAPTLSPGTMIKKGQLIGYANSLQGKYPGVTDHVHIEVWDLKKENVSINPATLF